MSQYATSTYYTDTFGGTLIPANEQNKYLQLASNKIDSITFNRIVGLGFDNLTAFQQGNIQSATCYQAEYMYEYGTETSKLASYSVLDINVTMRDNQSTASLNGMSEVAYNLVNQTGLNSGVM